MSTKHEDIGTELRPYVSLRGTARRHHWVALVQRGDFGAVVWSGHLQHSRSEFALQEAEAKLAQLQGEGGA